MGSLKQGFEWGKFGSTFKVRDQSSRSIKTLALLPIEWVKIEKEVV
jgi:hypothetical protein